MKIAIAQLNYHIGNFSYNSEKIIQSINKAKSDNVDLVVYSELSVCGYPPLDFLENRDFIESVNENVKLIASHCIGIAAIIGAPTLNPEEKGKHLYNSAIFLNNGIIESVHHKTLLPTYDIFDEYRYFEPGNIFNVIEYKNEKIALTICEDLWDDQPVENSFAKNKLYRVSPMDHLIKQNPTLMINIASSPFSYRQENARDNVLLRNAKKYGIPLIYVNQIGANTEIIFDGGSLAINRNAEKINQPVYFKEYFKVFDTNKFHQNKEIKEEHIDYLEKIYNALILGIRDYFGKSGLSKATLGLSGGIDSAVTLVLATEALGRENVHVLLLPSKYSSDHSIDDAKKLAENLKIKHDIIPIQDAVDQVNNIVSGLFKGMPEDVTEENIQARMRGLLLMALSNKFGNILLNTSNKSEAAVGYGTLYGDMNGGLSVLGDVYKTDVFKLARYINREKEIIPENTILKPPSAELRPDQKDSDSLPEYDILDQILYRYIELKEPVAVIQEAGFDETLIRRVIQMVNRNEYKRFQTPPILRISSKAFGLGRRMPIVAKY